MLNARAIGRVGVLVAGLGIGAAFASIPGTASADSSDWLFSTADNDATATSGQGDIAIAIGDGASAKATGGSGDFALADGSDALANAGGHGGTTTGNDDIAYVYDPSGTTGSVADAGANNTADGDYDYAAVFGVDGATASAQGADYAYAIVNLLDSESGSAETIGGFLSELLALF